MCVVIADAMRYVSVRGNYPQMSARISRRAVEGARA